MDTIAHIQGVLLGLIGWAATTVIVLGSSRLATVEQRAMIVFSWTIWMIPALGTLVYRQLLDVNTAAFYCIATTIAVALLVCITAIRWRTKS